MTKIAIFPGDGIGPEVTAEAIRVLEVVAGRSALDLKLVQFDPTSAEGSKTGFPFTPAQIEELKESFQAILVGTFMDQKAPYGRAVFDPIAELSSKLDLYVRYKPVRFLNRKNTPLKSIPESGANFTVLSHNLEGFSNGIGGAFHRQTSNEVSIQSCVYSAFGIERFLRHVFDFARQNGYKKIEVCGEWRGLQYEADLFQRVFAEVLANYIEIEVNYLSVSTLIQTIMTHPNQLELVVANNSHTSFIADLAAVLQGGTGMAAQGFIHPGRLSLFSPMHGALPQLAGKNSASPIASISAAALMLECLGYDQEADWIYNAIKYAVETDNITRDYGGRLKTEDVGKFIADHIKRGANTIISQ
ncbi:MAG: isocitrate/isopropylmalate family dehydrogenase [bacterium]|nr:isocitrate/isopropylmalate family dehydrogenase [bacterium]